MHKSPKNVKKKKVNGIIGKIKKSTTVGEFNTTSTVTDK